jgi:hypothetical protein
MNLLSNFIYIDRKFKDEQELHDAFEAAKAENHGVFCPTHPLRKDGEVVGYFSVGSPGYPVVFAWLGECIPPRESFSLVNRMENHVALAGATGICFPVPKSSPFHPLMGHMGYKNGGEYTFFYKPL